MQLEDVEDIKIHEKGLIMYCKTRGALDEEAKLADQAVKLGLKAIVMNEQPAFDRTGATRRLRDQIHYL